MVAILLIAFVLHCGYGVHLPSQTDYNVVYGMESQGLVPYLTPAFPPFSNDHIRLLARHYFDGVVPSSQNGTALALCLYDWSQPHFERIWLLQIFPDDAKAMGAAAYLHRVGRFFGIQATTFDGFMKAFLAAWDGIRQFTSETTLIEYALSMLEVPTQVPLFMGVQADDLFCRQIGVMGNVSGEVCLRKYFQPGTIVTTDVFWSTTPDESYASQYAVNGMFLVKPSLKTRSRNITAFTIASQAGGTEHLYPAGTAFFIKNCTTGRENFLTCSLEEL